MQNSANIGTKSGKSKTSGILMIVSGAIWVVSTVFGSWFIWAIAKAFSDGSSSTMPFSVIAAYLMPFSILGILAILGGIASVRRRAWGFALTGAICSILCFFPIGIIAVILTASSRQEFTK